ncbi:hypothetical protein BGX38DRAFT_1333018 [Terfezia claveryi]|nr:hypothetical protein BGX38DRAFT_1333018 [Terfezia claveryi]
MLDEGWQVCYTDGTGRAGHTASAFVTEARRNFGSTRLGNQIQRHASAAIILKTVDITFDCLDFNEQRAALGSIKDWEDLDRPIWIQEEQVIHKTKYQNFNTFRALEVTPERMNTAIARGNQLLESNLDDLPEFTREGTVDQIEEALRNPTMAILALDPVSEQIEDSITVHNHPGLSFHKEIEVPDSQDSAAAGSWEDSDSDMGSDSTTKPTIKSTRKAPLPTTTPEEDAHMLGFTPVSQAIATESIGTYDPYAKVIRDSQDKDNTATIFHDAPETDDTPALSPAFHQFPNEGLDDTASEESNTSIAEWNKSVTNNWDSRSALEGDRIDQLEVSIQKTVAVGVEQIVEASRVEKESTEAHSAVLVNIANDVTGHFEAQRMEFKETLQNLAEAQEETTKLYSNLGKTFNEHMRAQSIELTLIQDCLMAGLNLAVAAVRDEGAASRVKDLEDRLEIYRVLGEIYKDINSIKKAREMSEWHPYQASHSPSGTPRGHPFSPPFRPPPTGTSGGCPFSPPFLPLPTSPPLSRPPITVRVMEGTNFAVPVLGESTAPTPTPTGKRGLKEDIEFIDLSMTPNMPNLAIILSLPAGTISPKVSTDSRMSNCPVLLNKGAAPAKLYDSRHADSNSKPLECGGAKAPKADLTPKKSSPIEMTSNVTLSKQAGKEPMFIEPAIPLPLLPNKPTSPHTPRTEGKNKEVASEAGKFSSKLGTNTLKKTKEVIHHAKSHNLQRPSKPLLPKRPKDK